MQQEKNLESRTRLDEPDECASGGDPILLYKILHLLFFPLVRILCALRLESRKKLLHDLDAGPLEFQFLRPRGCLTNPFRNLSLCFEVTDKTPGLISRNNFVKKILDAIRRSFFTKSATAAMFTSVRVNIGRPPLLSSSTSSLPSQNREYHLKTFDWFRASFPYAFAPVLVFLLKRDCV